MKVGVEAWQEIDPLVHITMINSPEGSGVPYDGGCEARAGLARHGPGQRHVALRVRAAQHEQRPLDRLRSAIPLSPTVMVTNIGFHDVSYLGGDGNGRRSTFEATDWPGSFSGGVIAWSTTPYVTSDNANALRWGQRPTTSASTPTWPRCRARSRSDSTRS
jgi:hypothetical protein